MRVKKLEWLLPWVLPLVALLTVIAAVPLLTSTAVTAAPTTWDIQHFTTGDNGERTARLTLGDYPAPSPKYAVFCIDLGSPPQGGDILLATADMQVTNGLGYNVSVVTHLLLASGCLTDGTEIAEANGENAIPDVHHEVASRAGMITVAAGNSRQFVVLVAWAASTAAQPGHYLQVNQDYGRTNVMLLTRGG